MFPLHTKNKEAGMRKVSLIGLMLGLTLWLPIAAQASVLAKIDKSTQTMRVYVNGVQQHTWKVSTGKRGYNTPVGQWRPKVLERMHYSRKYNNSPMPYSIFFKGGYAIHGTNAIRRLGRRASHGCVRLHTNNARTLYSLVRKYGKSSTRIVISNSSRFSKAASKPSKRKKLYKKAAKRKARKQKIAANITANKAAAPDHRVQVILTGNITRQEILTEARAMIRGPLL
jgi:hypothetical protein